MKRIVWLILLMVLSILVSCQSDSQTKNEIPKTDENQIANNNTEDNKTSNSEEIEDLEGTLWEGDGNTGVILSHGAVYDADSWEDQGTELAENGMTTFAVEETTTDDIIKAAKILEDKYEIENLALIGASAGATSSIDATLNSDVEFDKVILLSPSGKPNDIEDTPVLVIYSESEGFDELEKQKTENIETVVMPGSAHAQELFDETNSADDTMQHILEFLNEK